ncbi:TonB-dependent receptor plug domain-containing protein [Aliikangiella coralliicola]|uniref:TonB-dependent receptor plug domain-containing protein n=1 Tax=Aliikangiella coralliicola TaxID=2592383 RepID=A0A545UAM9_9GAMM|nr:TonB-dependent receptor plug domain-containing protein [Aliikangiella coralliicola]TQV86521.1 hypothetical protein FLL46_16560 [Aliikangiella coralliicola]
MDRHLQLFLIISLFVVSNTGIALAAEPTAAELIELQLEDLVSMDIEVESAGKNTSKAFDLPYAAYVITADDISRNNIQNIPDALSMVPGVLVERMGASEWGVSIRGTGGRFARFVLVLINGRVTNNTNFSGVNWDELNVSINSIERVEVIRGPNADSWGANAVNGIINIITKNADSATKNKLRVVTGNSYRNNIDVYYNNNVNDNWFHSISIHRNDAEGWKNRDETIQQRDFVDSRVTYQLEKHSEQSELQFSLSHFRNKQSNFWTAYELPNVTQFENFEDKTGDVFQVNYHLQLTPETLIRSRLSYDITDRNLSLYHWDSENIQFDLETQHKYHQHLFDTGINLRHAQTDFFADPRFPVAVDPESLGVDYVGGFINGNFSLMDEKLLLKIGARIDNNSLTGYEFQPSTRLLWKASDKDRFWFAASQAASIPSVGLLKNTRTIIGAIPAENTGTGFPLVINITESHKVKNTRVNSVEFGYRHLWENMNIDLTAFRFEYENELMTSNLGLPGFSEFPPGPDSYLIQRLAYNSEKSFRTDGVEINLLARMSSDWKLQFSYSYLGDNDSGLEAVDHLASLQNSYQFTEDLGLELWLRYSSGNDVILSDDFVTADVNVNYQFSPGLHLNYTFKNLRESRYLEGQRIFFSIDGLYVEKAHYLTFSWSF